MLKAIPWDVIGPALSAVCLILIVVFGFILKFQKQSKPNSPLPVDINSTGKKTLCFQHEGKIASNKTAIEMIGTQLNTLHENNREDHNKIEKKIDDLGGKIIQAIDENSIRE